MFPSPVWRGGTVAPDLLFFTEFLPPMRGSNPVLGPILGASLAYTMRAAGTRKH